MNNVKAEYDGILKPLLVLSDSGASLEAGEWVPMPVREVLFALGGPVGTGSGGGQELIARMVLTSRNYTDYLCANVPYACQDVRNGTRYFYCPLRCLRIVNKVGRGIIRKEVA